MLVFAQWPRRIQPNPVADVAAFGLVVRHELGGALDVAVVHLVVEETVDRHHYRLLHLVRHHDTHHWLHLRPLITGGGGRGGRGRQRVDAACVLPSIRGRG